MKETMVHERAYEGLMRGDIKPERQRWGCYPNQYKIMADGTLVYRTLKPNEE